MNDKWRKERSDYSEFSSELAALARRQFLEQSNANST